MVEVKLRIQGWGPDCEVLAPVDLRQEIAEEMQRAGRCAKRSRETQEGAFTNRRR